ncbi:hypothetical protein PAMA_009678 [Pampus argenteus]
MMMISFLHITEKQMTCPTLCCRKKEKKTSTVVLSHTYVVLMQLFTPYKKKKKKLFIFPLQVTSATSSKIIAEQAVTSPVVKWRKPVLPSKPVAHLTDGQDVVHEKMIMSWSRDADPLLHEMDYKDNSLVIQKDGYYFVYSKVFFMDNGLFHHFVELHTEKYIGKSINLLQSRQYFICKKHRCDGYDKRSNSYLGGVFHLERGNAIFVKVSNTSKVLRHQYSENFFGAYMI